jgi:hypothetical protein
VGRFTSVIATSLLALACAAPFLHARGSQKARGHTEWVAESLKEIQKIKPGMTRADLLKVFAPEGGLSPVPNRTYAYRECAYIKVDVEFEPSAGGAAPTESDEAVIKSISRPYLARPILD